jgi:hypothetical protein
MLEQLLMHTGVCISFFFFHLCDFQINILIFVIIGTVLASMGYASYKLIKRWSK